MFGACTVAPLDKRGYSWSFIKRQGLANNPEPLLEGASTWTLTHRAVCCALLEE